MLSHHPAARPLWLRESVTDRRGSVSPVCAFEMTLQAAGLGGTGHDQDRAWGLAYDTRGDAADQKPHHRPEAPRA